MPVQVDHENDQQIANLFEKIKTEQNGRLDILVNNAYKGVNVFSLNIFIYSYFIFILNIFCFKNRQYLTMHLKNFGK